MLKFREILPDDAALLLQWRNSPRIAAGFASRVPDNVEIQMQWIMRCRQDPTAYHWIMAYDDAPFGYCRFHHWDREAATSRTGVYVGDERYGKYLMYGLDMLHAFIFYKLGVLRIISHIFSDNEKSARFTCAYGFSRDCRLENETALQSGRETRVYVLDRQTFKNKRHIEDCGEAPPTEYWTYGPRA